MVQHTIVVSVWPLLYLLIVFCKVFHYYLGNAVSLIFFSSSGDGKELTRQSNWVLDFSQCPINGHQGLLCDNSMVAIAFSGTVWPTSKHATSLRLWSYHMCFVIGRSYEVWTEFGSFEKHGQLQLLVESSYHRLMPLMVLTCNTIQQQRMACPTGVPDYITGDLS